MGFTWGLYHLISTLNLSTVGVARSDWAFGQVVPIVLLAAPIISIVEFFFDGEQGLDVHIKARLYVRTDDEAEERVILHNTVSTTSSAASVVSTTWMAHSRAAVPYTWSNASQASSARKSADSENTQLTTNTFGRVETLQLADDFSTPLIEGIRDEPDYDFYLEKSWSSWIIIYNICAVCTLSICIVVYTAMKYPMAEWVLFLNPKIWWTWTLFDIPFTI